MVRAVIALLASKGHFNVLSPSKATFLWACKCPLPPEWSACPFTASLTAARQTRTDARQRPLAAPFRAHAMPHPLLGALTLRPLRLRLPQLHQRARCRQCPRWGQLAHAVSGTLPDSYTPVLGGLAGVLLGSVSNAHALGVGSCRGAVSRPRSSSPCAQGTSLSGQSDLGSIYAPSQQCCLKHVFTNCWHASWHCVVPASVLAHTSLRRRRLKHAHTFSRGLSWHRIAPAPGLAFRPKLQRLGYMVAAPSTAPTKSMPTVQSVGAGSAFAASSTPVVHVPQRPWV